MLVNTAAKLSSFYAGFKTGIHLKKHRFINIARSHCSIFINRKKIKTLKINYIAFTGGICHRYLPVNTGMDNTPKSGVYRHLLAFVNISLISLQIILLTVLATYYITHGHHSTIFAAYA